MIRNAELAPLLKRLKLSAMLVVARRFRPH